MSVAKLNQSEYFSENFEDLKLSHENFKSIIFEECSFKNCDFSEASFYGCEFMDCGFSNCNLSNIKITNSRFSEVVFRDCKAIGINWTKADWPTIAIFSPIKFFKCIINNSLFFGLSLDEIEIEECKAHEVDFREGSFCRANFKYTDFTNSLFHETELKETDFTEATNYFINVNFNNIKKAKFSRYEALSLLEGLDIELIG